MELAVAAKETSMALEASKAVPAPISKPDELLVSRSSQPQDTVVRVGKAVIGGGGFCVIAGPCSVESPEQLMTTARAVSLSGAMVLRAGAYKPRTSPYSFQGMGPAGLELLAGTGRSIGLPVVTEVMDSSDIPLVAEHADIIQVGTRNMQNFSLLKKLGKIGRPILLKRGLMSTIKEFLMSAEYIMAAGNPQIILCERGIRTFETATRNTLDLSAVCVLKEKTHLPVIVDPSHAVGYSRFVIPLSRAALAVGADGLMVEVHCSPEQALCDGEQSLRPKEFGSLMAQLKELKGLMAH